MPVRFEIDAEQRRIYTTWEGAVTLKENQDFIRALSEHPDFDPTFDQLSDARAVTAAVPSDRLADLARSQVFAAGSRRAILVESDLVFGVSRMYQAYAGQGGPEVRVFRDPDEANVWLDRQDEE